MPRPADPIYDRHARLFGDIGQEILRSLKVGIIGLGGGGSLLNEWLARLGVGHIVAVDYQREEPTNLPRIVGATRLDALAHLRQNEAPWVKALRARLARYKVHIARRVARQANPAIRYDAIVGDVLDEPIARQLTDVDFLFLASDSIQSRLVFNALVQQYLIPGAQIGAKVSVNRTTREIEDIHVATRPVLPNPQGGCLSCHGLIIPTQLEEESLGEGERRGHRYVEDDQVHEPSVITLNALSAAQAANDLMMMFTGLYRPGATLSHQLGFVRERLLNDVEPTADPACLDCSSTGRSRRARGDRIRLPCRVRPRT